MRDAPPRPDADTAATLRLAEQLIACPSVTPQDAGCQRLIAERLRPLGFDCETLVFGPPDAPVTNLWALRRGRAHAQTHAPPYAPSGGGLLVLAGHTDVVPTGPLSAWASAPFAPTRRDGRLYGRGAADMKTSIAAMVTAAEAFVRAHPDAPGSLALLITSDEEGPSVDGTAKVCHALRARGERLDWCIVGEPTSVRRLGDTVKNGRRGSLSGRLTVRGVQGHIAYPQLARNPIHLAVPALAELAAVEWDAGNAHFPPTGWQMSNVHAGTGAGNVIPGEMAVDFNFRFGTESTPSSLKARLTEVLDRHGLDHTVAWTLGGEPFLTPAGDLCEALTAAIAAETGVGAQLSTTGGTSDGRFIAKICPQVVEFGPVNASIHQVDEHVEIADVEPLARIYRRTIEALLAAPTTPASP